MRSKTVLFLIILMVFAGAMAVAKEERGAAEITLEGGTRGKVPFPHQKHQDTLTDCNICHNVFPQSPGTI